MLGRVKKPEYQRGNAADACASRDTANRTLFRGVEADMRRWHATDIAIKSRKLFLREDRVIPSGAAQPHGQQLSHGCRKPSTMPTMQAMVTPRMSAAALHNHQHRGGPTRAGSAATTVCKVMGRGYNTHAQAQSALRLGLVLPAILGVGLDEVVVAAARLELAELVADGRDDARAGLADGHHNLRALSHA